VGLDENILKRSNARVAEFSAAEPELADVTPDPAVTEANKRVGLRCIEIVANICGAYAGRQALGQRMYELVADPSTGRMALRYLPAYRTISYRELQDRYQALANSWHAGEQHKVSSGQFVCILGFASTDFVVVDLACFHAGATSVPLQTNMRLPDLERIVAETEPRCFVASIEHLEKIVAVVRAGAVVPSIVVMDYEPGDDDQRRSYDEAQAALTGSATDLTTLDKLIERGRVLPPVPAYLPAPSEDPLTTIFYTSGSTGSPKGAMYPDSLYRRYWANGAMPTATISLSFLPFNHALGRLTAIRTLASGGVCYFAAKSDMSTLFEDIRLVRPTLLELVPRVAEMIYHHFQEEVSRRLARGETGADSVRGDLMLEMRANFLGGRIKMGEIGSAPSSSELKEFISNCFDISLTDAYGSSEAGPIALNGQFLRPRIIDYRLIDVPELGYFRTDRPYPRGELYLKTATAIPAYFKHPEATAALFDPEGYLRTGDIVEERGPDRISIVDRRNTVLKLAQGEFVAITTLEPIFASRDPLIRQVYLYGNSTRSFLLGVLVPDWAVARERLGHEPEASEIKNLLRAAIREIAQAERLRPYEVPRDFLVESEPFSNVNGLLSSVGKHLRPRLKAKYGERLEALYSELEANRRREFEELGQGDSEQGVAERLRRAMEATLGLTDLDVSTRATFAELGGDSLASVSLSLLLEKMFGIPVPVSAILNPVSNLKALADFIETALRSGAPATASFVTVHGENAIEIFAADFKLETFIDAGTLAAAPSASSMRSGVRVVLLTGATGFLGRFLCLEWLKRVAPLGGKVICLIRAADAQEARVRLDAALGEQDRELAQSFTELAAGHLEVLTADLALRGLGLTTGDYHRLAEEVDLIVHSGALVNHRLGYRQLFEPNVVGTAGLIALALTQRMKRIDYVSTVVASYLAAGGSAGEDEDIRVASPSWRLDNASYANGYGISKWASEVLLRDAHERFHLPVNVYRSDMILAHSEYAGQINASDIFTRLLFSVARTGLAPHSFYEPDANGVRARGHYNGLPVDFVAAAIAAIGAGNETVFATYHVNNPHDDGISLDWIVDWMSAEGYPIERVAAYADWLRRFEEKLRDLPEKQRQQSSLAVIEQLRSPVPAGGEKQTECPRFREKVRRLGVHPSGDIPKLSSAFIRKCFDDLTRLGMVEPVANQINKLA